MACMLCQQKLWMTNPTFVTKLMTTNMQISSLKSNAHCSCSSHRFLNAVKFQLSVTNGEVRHMLPFIKPYSSRMSYHNTKCYMTKQQCGGEQMGLKESLKVADWKENQWRLLQAVVVTWKPMRPMQLEHEDWMAVNLVAGRDERYEGVPRLDGRQGRSLENFYIKWIHVQNSAHNHRSPS